MWLQTADKELFMYCMSHSLLAMWILSAFSTPHVVEARSLRRSVSSPPISKMESPWRGVLFSVTRGLWVVLACCWCLFQARRIEHLIVWLSDDEIKSQAFLQRYFPAFMWSRCTLHKKKTHDKRSDWPWPVCQRKQSNMDKEFKRAIRAFSVKTFKRNM